MQLVQPQPVPVRRPACQRQASRHLHLPHVVAVVRPAHGLVAGHVMPTVAGVVPAGIVPATVGVLAVLAGAVLVPAVATSGSGPGAGGGRKPLTRSAGEPGAGGV